MFWKRLKAYNVDHGNLTPGLRLISGGKDSGLMLHLTATLARKNE